MIEVMSLEVLTESVSRDSIHSVMRATHNESYLLLGGRWQFGEIKSIDAQSVVQMPDVLTEAFQQANCTQTDMNKFTVYPDVSSVNGCCCITN